MQGYDATTLPKKASLQIGTLDIRVDLMHLSRVQIFVAAQNYKELKSSIRLDEFWEIQRVLFRYYGWRKGELVIFSREKADPHQNYSGFELEK